MSNTDQNPETGDDGSGTGRTERSFTCTVCGYPMTHDAGRLQTEVGSVCHNCGDWTTQSADLAAVLQEVREVAESLAGEILTERQALAYLLREVVGIDRATAAEEMDSTPSNVDNLHRRATEKIDDARRLVDELAALRDSREADKTEGRRDSG